MNANIIRRTLTRIVVSGAAVATLAASPALAANPHGGSGSGSGSGTSGSCSVTPSVVAPGADYTMVGNNLGASRVVNVTITDSHGTQSYSVWTDSSGTATLSSRSYWSGTDNVKITDTSRKASTLASCSFQVS